MDRERLSPSSVPKSVNPRVVVLASALSAIVAGTASHALGCGAPFEAGTAGAGGETISTTGGNGGKGTGGETASTGGNGTGGVEVGGSGGSGGKGTGGETTSSGGNGGMGGTGGLDAGGAGGAGGSDPCANALNGFKVTVKGLPNNKYDWSHYRAGLLVDDSLANNVAETGDSVIQGVKYDDVLVVQSEPDVSGAPEPAKYATENVVELPAGCITEDAMKRGYLTYVPISDVEFQAINDTCATCTSIANGSASPDFYYEYKNPSSNYKSTVYKITFKKP